MSEKKAEKPSDRDPQAKGKGQANTESKVWGIIAVLWAASFYGWWATIGNFAEHVFDPLFQFGCLPTFVLISGVSLFLICRFYFQKGRWFSAWASILLIAFLACAVVLMYSRGDSSVFLSTRKARIALASIATIIFIPPCVFLWVAALRADQSITPGRQPKVSPVAPSSKPSTTPTTNPIASPSRIPPQWREPPDAATIEAVSRKLSGWKGDNPHAVYEWLRNHGRTPDEIAGMNWFDVRMAFSTAVSLDSSAATNFPVITKIGGDSSRPCERDDFARITTVSELVDAAHAHCRWLDNVLNVGDNPDARAHVHALYASEAANRLGVRIPPPVPKMGTLASVEQKWFMDLANAALATATAPKIAPVPNGRNLSEWQRVKFHAWARSHPGQFALILASRGAETQAFAEQICNELRDAGWKLPDVLPAPPDQAVLDLQVSVSNSLPAYPVGVALSEIIRQVKLKGRQGVIYDPTIPDRWIVLWVGGASPADVDPISYMPLGPAVSQDVKDLTYAMFGEGPTGESPNWLDKTVEGKPLVERVRKLFYEPVPVLPTLENLRLPESFKHGTPKRLLLRFTDGKQIAFKETEELTLTAIAERRKSPESV